MRRNFWSEILFTASLLVGAPALAHRLFGIRMEFWPLPVTNLEWVNEPICWTLAAVLMVAGAVVGRSAVMRDMRERAGMVR